MEFRQKFQKFQSFAVLSHKRSVIIPRPVRIIGPLAASLFFIFIVIQVYDISPQFLPKTPSPLYSNYGSVPSREDDEGHYLSYRFPPTPSTHKSVFRGNDNVVWSFDQRTKWQAVGQHPKRNECWTYQDRFGAYAISRQLAWNISTIISEINESENRRAIILRLAQSQVWRPEFISHVRSLVMEAGYLAKWDIIIMIHLDLSRKARAEWLKRIPLEFLPLVQVVTTKQLQKWIPKPAKFKSFYDHNHSPIQMFMEHNPKYDFVYSLENDVRLIGRWDHFLADVDAEYSFHRNYKQDDQYMPEIADLITFQAPRQPTTSWPWLDKECTEYFGGIQNLRNHLGVMWGWSRRLTDLMTEHNAKGVNCYYEYFAPSIAYKENLTTFFYQHPIYCPRSEPTERISLAPDQLGKNDPQTVQSEGVAGGCTYYFLPKFSQPFWEDWYHDPKLCRPPALVHPVKGEFWN